MSTASNDSKYRESLDHDSVKKEIGICAWCKDQVSPVKELEHASTCAMIPDEEKAKIMQRHKGAVEKLAVDECRQ